MSYEDLSAEKGEQEQQNKDDVPVGDTLTEVANVLEKTTIFRRELGQVSDYLENHPDEPLPEAMREIVDSDLELADAEDLSTAIQARMEDLENRIEVIKKEGAEMESSVRQNLVENDNYRKTGTLDVSRQTIFSEDIPIIKEHGEEPVLDILSECYVQRFDQNLDEERDKTGYTSWQRNLENRERANESQTKLTELQKISETVLDAFQEALEGNSEWKKKLKQYGSRSAEDHLAHIIYRLSGVTGERFRESKLESDATDTLRGIFEYDENRPSAGLNAFIKDEVQMGNERFPILLYDQTAIASFMDELKDKMSPLAENSDFEALIPNDRRQVPFLSEGLKKSSTDLFFVPGSIAEQSQIKRRGQNWTSVDEKYEEEEQKREKNRSAEKDAMKLRLESEYLSRRLEDFQDFDREALVAKIDSARSFQKWKEKIDSDTWRDRLLSEESMVVQEIRPGLSEYQEKQIKECEAIIESLKKKNSEKPGLFASFQKNKLAEERRERKEGIEKNQEYIESIRNDAQKAQKREQQEEERRVEKLWSDNFYDLVHDIQDSPQFAGRDLKNELLTEGATVGSIALRLKGYVEQVARDELSPEESERLDTYDELRRRKNDLNYKLKER